MKKIAPLRAGFYDSPLPLKSLKLNSLLHYGGTMQELHLAAIYWCQNIIIAHL